MGKQLTTKDLSLDDETEEEEDTIEEVDPEEDSSAKFKGSPDHGTIGAEVVADEVEKAKLRQKKAEEDRSAEELEKVEGKKEERLQYKDQVAAEKAVREAKKKMTEATTKASKLQSIVLDLEKRVATAAKEAPVTAPAENPWDIKRQKVADDTITKAAAIPSPVPPQDRDDPEFDAKWADYQKKMVDYNSQIARAWAATQAEIANLAMEEREEAKKNQEAVMSAVDSALESVGLVTDKTNPKEVEEIKVVFWAFSAQVPKSLSMEDQIKEAAALCKNFIDNQRGHERERVKKERDNQEDLQVLGRGSRVTTTKTEPEITSFTMGEAQRAAIERRKLRHNP